MIHYTDKLKGKTVKVTEGYGKGLIGKLDGLWFGGTFESAGVYFIEEQKSYYIYCKYLELIKIQSKLK